MITSTKLSSRKPITIPMILQIVLVIVLSYILHLYLSRNFNFWRLKNVPHIKPTPIFGNFTKSFLLQENIGETFSHLYNKFTSPYFGVYLLGQPSFVVRDPSLIKRVLMKDFNYFSDHIMMVDEEIDPLTGNLLFFSKYPQWKDMRHTLSPILTIEKIKKMFPLIKKVGDDMVVYLQQQSLENSFEVKDLCMKFATDVITSCAFGVEGRSFQCPDASFKKNAEMLFSPTLRNSICQGAYFVAQSLIKFFKLSYIDPTIASFLRTSFQEIITQRKQSGIKRGDAIDLIMELKGQTSSSGLFKYEGDRLLAQVVNFFFAGIDSVTTTASFALYELSLNQEIQKTLRNEIKNKIDEHQSVNYECLQNLHFLDMVIEETLRKYPLSMTLDRQCVQDYKVPNSDVVIPKGTPLFIPVLGLQYDPKYFPNASKFDPERFSKFNKKNITPCSYLSFGYGPRHCIGSKLAVLMLKICLVNIISNFEVLTCRETPKSIKFCPKAFLPLSSVGLPIIFKKLSSNKN